MAITLRRCATCSLMVLVTHCASTSGGSVSSDPARSIAGADSAGVPARESLAALEQWRMAAWDALSDPVTWGPVLGAIVLAGTADRPIADWASRETPLFGDSERARIASDRLRTTGDIMMIITAIAVPDSGRVWHAKLGRVLVEKGAPIGAVHVTVALKNVTHRERPDHSDPGSFPSGHATLAFAYRAASLENLDRMALPRGPDIGLRVALTGLAAATAWARVEAGVHYPSDVLAGAGIGNFIVRLVHDGFFGPGPSIPLHVQVARSGLVVTLRIE
jgi:membrane-associated phospholipid phosphatase